MSRTLAITSLLPILMVTPGLLAQVQEDFENVTETGGGEFFSGAGFAEIDNWDDGISGESGFAGTAGNAHFGSVAAMGAATGGVNGSGAGLIDVMAVNFNLLDERFSRVTGTGGGVFLDGDGTADTFNFTLNWDDGIGGEGAFAGTFGGAALLGSVSAQGLPGGGFDGLGGGQLIVDDVDISSGNWFAGLQWQIGPFPGATPLLNPNFDADGATLDDWEVFSAGFNVLPETITPLSEPGVCKMFGQFTGAFNASGIFQRMPAQPGQTWEIDVWSRHNTGDSITGTSNYVTMKIEFLDATETVILSDEVTILDSASTLDTWLDNTPLQLTAPAGTVEVRPVFTFVQPAGTFEGGAALLDNASMKQVGGPGNVDLANYEMLADVRGIASAVAGEVQGDIQLRIEDPDGDRLIFFDGTDGGWNTVGGPLDTAVEADSTGTPAVGVFDIDAASYTVVVAFDNDATAWGTGGTLEVDNLAVTNDNSEGSEWFAGLFWDDLSLPEGDLESLELSADVLGSVVGGAYELRLEAFELIEGGLDESFSTVTGTGGGVFLDPNDVANEIFFGFDDDWDEGVTGEGAFGGVFGQVDILPGGGFSAQGLTSGGTDGAGSGEIRVDGVIFGPGGGWYAGLDWGGQALASTDLSQVVLSADVKGTRLGGSFGDYELRLEDPQGDRLYFPATANGSWQSLGGPLSTALEGGALGGGGDGSFDLDAPSYTVVISFVEPETTWEFGGVLEVDNLFITPATTRNEIGRVTFNGVADGLFQSIGGLLSDGISTFGDYFQDFSTATGTGGGEFYAANGGGILGGFQWDDGIENEEAFAGVWGTGVLDFVTAEACLDCGVDGGAAGRLSVEGAQDSASGGWWAGLTFTNLRADLSGDLSQIEFAATIKGEADTGAGQSLGTYTLRLEDAQTDFLAFDVAADGTFQQVGGFLSDATPGSTPDGDGVFDYTQATYSAVLVFTGPDQGWGSGGTLTIDDLRLTGIGLADADTYTVTVTFADEVATWGTDGMLAVDNLNFGIAAGCPEDLDGDGEIGLSDLSTLLSHFGGPGGPEDGDIDGDGDVTLTDLSLLLAVFGSSCD